MDPWSAGATGGLVFYHAGISSRSADYTAMCLQLKGKLKSLDRKIFRKIIWELVLTVLRKSMNRKAFIL